MYHRKWSQGQPFGYFLWYVNTGFLWYGKPVATDPIPPKRPRGRPPTGVTPKRNIRVAAVWDDAAAIANARGETITSVIEAALRRYVARHGRTDAAG